MVVTCSGPKCPHLFAKRGNRFKRAIETFAQHIVGGDSLLFMVVAKHTAEDCPGGLVRPDKDFLAKVVESVGRSGVTLTEIYLDAPGHVYFLIVDAEDNEALNIALEQFRLVGKVNTHPVLKLSDATAWAKKIGIQR